MKDDLLLFPEATEEQARDATLDKMGRNLSPERVREMSAFIREIKRRAESGVPFTADDVLPPVLEELGIQETHLIGLAFHKMRLAGLIRVSGYARSKRKGRHASLIRQWTGMKGGC